MTDEEWAAASPEKKVLHQFLAAMADTSTKNGRRMREALIELVGQLPPELRPGVTFPRDQASVAVHAMPAPAGYVTDLRDGAAVMLTDPDDIGIAIYTRPQLDAARGLGVSARTKLLHSMSPLDAVAEATRDPAGVQGCAE